MSNSKKTRLQALGDQLVRAATTPVALVQPETGPAPEKKIDRSDTARRKSMETAQQPVSAKRPPAPPDRNHQPGKDKTHLTRLRPGDHERFMAMLVKALRLPAEATDQLPVVFLDPQLRPLKIGTHDDLMQRYELESGKARKAIRHALGAALISRLPYQRALLQHNNRYDLDGNIAGEVSEEDKDAARQQIAQIWQKIRQAKEATKGS